MEARAFVYVICGRKIDYPHDNDGAPSPPGTSNGMGANPFVGASVTRLHIDFIS